MTREQCAHMLVACWPYFPRMGSLVGAVAEAEHPGAFKRLEDHLQVILILLLCHIVEEAKAGHVSFRTCSHGGGGPI